MAPGRLCLLALAAAVLTGVILAAVRPQNSHEPYAIQLSVGPSGNKCKDDTGKDGIQENNTENDGIQENGTRTAGARQTMSASVMNLYSNHVLLIRLEDFQTIQEYQSEAVIYPASLTKIMTVILAIEALDDFDEEIVIQPSWIEALQEKNASVAGFLPMESVCVRDLLYAALLPSGADAAVALACKVSGSEQAFAALMNEKARSLGMKDTCFVNATGLHDANHVTTLKDMSLLLDYALDNAIFRRIFTTHEYQTRPTKLHENGIYLESTLFGRLDAVAREDGRIGSQGELSDGGWLIGGKTGYTPQAGLCLASLAQIYDVDYILLTAGACGDTQTIPYHILDAVEVYTHIG